jgi:hypothetical protein
MFGCGKGGDTIEQEIARATNFLWAIILFLTWSTGALKEMTGYLCYCICFESHMLVIFYIDFIYINIFYF